jgi:hypothetical protein
MTVGMVRAGAGRGKASIGLALGDATPMFR